MAKRVRSTDTGLIKPRRPCPPDFRDRYIELGWDGSIEAHYRTNWRCIRRWILESGGQELRDARAAYVRNGGRRMGSVPTDMTDGRWYDKRSKRIPR